MKITTKITLLVFLSVISAFAQCGSGTMIGSISGLPICLPPASGSVGSSITTTFSSGVTTGTLTHNFGSTVHEVQCIGATSHNILATTAAAVTLGANADSFTFSPALSENQVCVASTGGLGPNGTINQILTSNGVGGYSTPLNAPAGTIVGTTDIQSLTNKTVDGVPPATLGFMDATSSVQTQINSKAPLASPTFTGTVTLPIPGSIQCLHVSALGVVTGTGSDCGAGGGSMVYPGAGVAVSTGTAWTTSLTAPASALVGISDTQSLTNKTVDGVPPATMAFMDATSSVQTQMNAKAPAASPTFTGTVTLPVSGSTQCLHVSSGGVVTGTGSDCGAGGGGATSVSQLTDLKPSLTSSTVANIQCPSAQCNVLTGYPGTSWTISTAGNATISAGSGNAYVYVTAAGILTVGHNGLTLACDAGCAVATSVTAFPSGSWPIAVLLASSGTWSSATDKRPFGTAAVLSTYTSPLAVDGSGNVSCSGCVARIATGTKLLDATALGASSIAANSCATVVTVSTPGVLSTDVLAITPNADISGATGYGFLSTDGLKVYYYPVADNLKFKVCNQSGASITFTAISVNYLVTR